MANAATPKQIQYASSLFDKLVAASEAGGFAPDAEAFVESRVAEISEELAQIKGGGAVSKVAASRAIEVLKGLLTAAVPTDVRWHKSGADWYLRGAEAVLTKGATVTVTKANGQTSTVKVGEVVSTNFGITLATAAPAAEVPLGIHRGQGDFDGRFIAVKLGRQSRRPQGYVIAEDGSHNYTAGSLSGLSEDTLLTLEEAQQVWIPGEVVNCFVCGAELTDPDSREAGIGPVCASKF